MATIIKTTWLSQTEYLRTLFQRRKGNLLCTHICDPSRKLSRSRRKLHCEHIKKKRSELKELVEKVIGGLDG